MECSPSNIKVSLITVTYNAAETLGDTIRSVLNQSHQDIEYILVDGASKDNTVDIIQSFARTDDRIKWISEADKGLYDAMNKGIRMATGELVGILNADDFFSSNDVIASVVHAFYGSLEIDAVFGDIEFVATNNLKKVIRKYSSSIFRSCLFRWGFMPAHPTFYCKRELFDKLGYYHLDFKIAADYELLVRFILINKIKTKYLKKTFVSMRVGGKSTQGIMSTIIINKEIVKACKLNGIYTNLPMVYCKYFFKIKELI
jgi:glycosyltransferase involved in cell wall biosynthesis